MTGESMPLPKDRDHPFMLSGCTVSDGSGTMLVTAVGRHSEWGRTMAKLAVEPEITPMQRALGDMAELISWLGMEAPTDCVCSLKCQASPSLLSSSSF